MIGSIMFGFHIHPTAFIGVKQTALDHLLQQAAYWTSPELTACPTTLSAASIAAVLQQYIKRRTGARILQAPTLHVIHIETLPAFALVPLVFCAVRSFSNHLDDPNNDEWDYERGRCFGFIAPINMALRVNGKLNPKALQLAEAAFVRRLLI
jgi:hypothetical protein